MLKYYIHKAFTLPPHVTVKKAADRINQTVSKVFLRRKDHNVFSYAAESPPNGKLLFCFPKLAAEQLLFYAETISGVTKYYLTHRFNLLGSGWVQVKHGMRCSGLEGYRYDMGSPIQVDPEGRCLEGRINRVNLEESKRIWKLIFHNQLKIQNSILKTHTPIDWHLDFKSGYRWSESIWYEDISSGHKIGADVKVPWELARCQHLITLSLAHYSANNGINGFEHPEKYAFEFRNQVLGFIATNPPRWGVNWLCTMEVGIRVANWLVAYDILRGNGAEFDLVFEKELLRSAYDHGLHIVNNLEYLENLSSNHYLSNIAGLLFVAAYLPQSAETDKWLKFAVDELKNEMAKQVYPDGTDFEASTCYHRLVLELFFYPALLMIRKDDGFDGGNHKAICEHIFGGEFTDRLYKMFDVVCYLLKPNGKMPQIGDNDSGQFFKLYPREVLDVRYLLALGSVFFGEAKWKIKEFFQADEDIVEVAVLYGEKGIKTWKALSTTPLSSAGSRSFADSGWYIMRDDSIYCVISCGPNGQNDFGGHCHNDKLSFELNIDGEDIIIDPSSYLYTPHPKSRNLFRSTAYHNTVVIDGEEQNRFEDWTLFLVKNDSRAKCLKWESDKNRDVFVGEHYGYKRLREPVTHRREIIFDKKTQSFKINDRFIGKGEHLFEWYFHFAPDVDVKLIDDKSIAAKPMSGLQVVLSAETTDDSLQIEVLDGWVSFAYGKKEKARVARYSMKSGVDLKMFFEIGRC